MKFRKIILIAVLTMTTQAISRDTVPVLDAATLRELRCLELNIYHEARGEGRAGMIAVGMVTLNRMRSRKFPDSVCAVVKQRGQFSWYGNKTIYAKVPQEIRQIAYDLLITGRIKDNTGGSLYFHNRSVRSFDRKMKTRIGNHIFYI